MYCHCNLILMLFCNTLLFWLVGVMRKISGLFKYCHTRMFFSQVCHSKSGEVNPDKVANLVKAYVDKYKRIRKNKSDKS